MGNISDNLIFMLMMMLAFKKIHIMLGCVYCNSIYVMKRCCISQYLSNIYVNTRCPPAPVHYYVTHPRVPAAVIQQLENSLAVE